MSKPQLSFYIPCTVCKTNITHFNSDLKDSFQASQSDTTSSIYVFSGRCPICKTHNTISISHMDSLLESTNTDYLKTITDQLDQMKKFFNLTNEMKSSIPNIPPEE